MARLNKIISFVVFVCCFVIVKSGLTISGGKCGSKICSPMEYCSSFGNLCQSCTGICDKSHHNFDEERCNADCQNYLHYMLFKQNPNFENDGDLRAEVRSLHYTVTVTLTLTCLILVFLAIVLLVKIFRWKKKHHVTISWLRSKLKPKEKSKSERPSNISTVTASVKPDLHLDMPSVGLQTPSVNGNTPSTATTTISRRPTEDNTLDYAYDNPAMVSTPSPNATPHESSL